MCSNFRTKIKEMTNKNLQNRVLLQQKLAEVIKNKRIEQKKSISLISAEVGMTKSMWADMEKGIKDPQFSTLFRMAEGLNVPIGVLLDETIKKLPDNFSLID